MTKKRNFSLVFHNVSPASKPRLEEFVKTQGPTRYVCGCEAYPDQEGFHTHLFVSFKHGREFKSVVDKYQQWSLENIVVPKPEGETRAWGRVEVDQMFGTFEDAINYLQGNTKDKPIDEAISDYQDRKGMIVCDVCSGMTPWFAMKYTFSNKLGRCHKCSMIPHRMLQNYGFNVREIPFEGY